MARIHKLQPKLDIIDVLRREFVELESNPKYKESLALFRQWVIAELSAQVVALTMELTDDLAAVCVAYRQALESKDKAFIEHLSNFGRGKGHQFYERVARDRDEAAKAVGLDPESSPAYEVDIIVEKFSIIKKMRDKFWDYYIGYKHGQFATPMVFQRPGDQPSHLRGLYMIPRPIARDRATKKLQTGDRFVNIDDSLSILYSVAVDCVSLSIQTRDRQYPRIYGLWT